MDFAVVPVCEQWVMRMMMMMMMMMMMIMMMMHDITSSSPFFFNPFSTHQRTEESSQLTNRTFLP